MSPDRRIIHILDDTALGGVTRALDNFNHPRLKELGRHDIVDIRSGNLGKIAPADIAVIHFTGNWRKLAWLLNLKVRRLFSRIILVEHSYTEGFENSEVANKVRFRQMLKTTYSLVDTVVAVSQAQRHWIVSKGLAPLDKVIAISQSRACPDLLNLEPRRHHSGPLKLGAYGRLHRQKGFDLLLAAMANISGDQVQLKIAGTGPEESALKASAKDLLHVEICAPFSSPRDFLNEVDMIVIPSRWEAFGLVGTEARAAGRPILAARVDGLLDQLGEAALSHTCNSVPGLVSALRYAASLSDLPQRGQALRQDMRGEFDRMIDGWADLLTEESRKSIAA